MKMRRGILGVAFAAIFCCAAAGGQEAQPTHAPDPAAKNLMGGYPIPPIPGVAFSARASMLIKTTLADGTLVERKVDTWIARDSQGRVYNERRIIEPANKEGESQLVAADLYDPETGTHTACTIAQKVCTTTAGRPRPAPKPLPEGVSADGKISLTRTIFGSETLEGVEVQHAREKRIYAVGAMGNDKPLTALMEYWYSPLLQIYLAYNQELPNGSIHVVRVTDVNLSEPEAAWFKPPEGFRVVDARAGATGTH